MFNGAKFNQVKFNSKTQGIINATFLVNAFLMTISLIQSSIGSGRVRIKRFRVTKHKFNGSTTRHELI
jgi:hypothetical protein